MEKLLSTPPAPGGMDLIPLYGVNETLSMKNRKKFVKGPKFGY